MLLLYSDSLKRRQWIVVLSMLMRFYTESRLLVQQKEECRSLVCYLGLSRTAGASLISVLEFWENWKVVSLNPGAAELDQGP